MSILTDDEVAKLIYTECGDDSFVFARAIEAAVIKKLSERSDPVAIVGDVYQLLWFGSSPIAAITSKHGIRVGDKLYTHPAPQSEWQPIETAPKDKNRVLIFSEKRGVREARFYNENSDGTVWYDMIVGGGPMTIFYDVTHWQPLPQPPEAK